MMDHTQEPEVPNLSETVFGDAEYQRVLNGLVQHAGMDEAEAREYLKWAIPMASRLAQATNMTAAEAIERIRGRRPPLSEGHGEKTDDP